MAISFSGDNGTTVASLEDVLSTLGSTAFWTATTAQYGVGAATAVTPVHLTETAPSTIDDAQIQTWLKAKLAGTTLGTPNAQTIYTVFYPTGTTITYGGMSSCISGGFGGYHGSLNLPSGLAVPYAVLPRCAAIPGLTVLQTVTASLSHELIEAATDPYPNSNPAYQSVDQDHVVWELVLLGEVSDLCVADPNANYIPAGYAYVVQRSWSNSAVTSGKDFCQPSLPGDVYFQSVPVMNDSVGFSYHGQPTGAFTKGVHIPLNTSKTIDVDLYSEGPTSAWTVSAQPYTMGTLSFSWNKTTGSNGEVLQLTITALSHDPEFGGAPFFIISSKGNTYRLYLGFVN